MKIFFIASSASSSEIQSDYESINQAIVNSGNEIFQLYDYSKMSLSEIMLVSEEEKAVLYDKWKKIVEQIDVAIVDVSMPGTINLGACLSGLIDKGKPMLCMYHKGFKPTLVTELYSSKMLISEYSAETIHDVITWGIDELKLLLNHRFTMNLPVKHDLFVIAHAKMRGITRSEYIRELIEREMGKK